MNAWVGGSALAVTSTTVDPAWERSKTAWVTTPPQRQWIWWWRLARVCLDVGMEARFRFGVFIYFFSPKFFMQMGGIMRMPTKIPFFTWLRFPTKKNSYFCIHVGLGGCFTRL